MKSSGPTSSYLTTSRKNDNSSTSIFVLIWKLPFLVAWGGPLCLRLCVSSFGEIECHVGLKPLLYTTFVFKHSLLVKLSKAASVLPRSFFFFQFA